MPTDDTLDPSQIVRRIFGSAFRFVRGFSGGTSVNSPGHQGWDISAALGSAVPALASGRVVYAEDARKDVSKASKFWTTGGGNVVIIEDAKGIRYHYAHLDYISARVGDIVGKGAVIGAVGSTGDSTGPHLHFSMVDTKKHVWVDPARFMLETALGDAIVKTNTVLGAFGNIVTLQLGQTLTASDVDDIIRKLDAAHFFQAKDQVPILAQLSENAARDKTRAILMSHTGELWTKSLQDKLQVEFFGAADAAVQGPEFQIAGALDTIVGMLATLLNPSNWIKIGALIIGLFLTFAGFRAILEASSISSPVSV